MKFNLLAGFILVLFLIGTASAFQPASGETRASDTTTSGSEVTAKYIIDFPPRGSEGTFPADHNLVITTRLENPQWTYSLILDGVKNPNKTVTTEQLTLSGFELNYPSSAQQTVVVYLKGMAPEVSRVTMTSIFDIRETDTSGTIIPNASRSDSAIPIYPRVTTTPSPVSTPSPKNPDDKAVLLQPNAPSLTLPQLAWLTETFQTAQVTILPKGDITAGTPVTVSYRKNFPRSGSRTFPLDHELFFVSELDNPQWSYSIILGGNENPRVPRGGTALGVSGFELSYPCDRYEDLVVTVRGTAPSTGTVSEKTVLMVSEKDNAGDVVAGSTVVKTAAIIPAQG